jgi:hypothetical protein
MGFCFAAYRPTAYRVDPNPRTTSGSGWLVLTPTLFRYYRLEDMGTTYEHNRSQIDRKAWLLRVACVLVTGEVICLSVAQIAG